MTNNDIPNQTSPLYNVQPTSHTSEKRIFPSLPYTSENLKFINKFNFQFSDLTDSEYITLCNILLKYKTCYATHKNDDGKISTPFRIRLKPNAQLMTQRPSKVPIHYRDKLNVLLKGFEKDNIIKQIGYSPQDKPVYGTTYLNPLIIIPKGDTIKCVLDARHLNSNTEQSDESWPIEPLAPQLARANKKYKSAIDLMYAYAHTPLDEDTIKLTGFSSGDKLFAFIRGFYGLKGLPNFFTEQMSTFFKTLIEQGFALVYIDDILLLSDSKEHMFQLIEQLHIISTKNNPRLAPEKIFFMLLKVKFLGHEIGYNAIKPIHSKIAAIHKIPSPTGKVALLSFIGALNFYTKFIEKLHLNLKPFYDLLHENTPWKWTDEHESLFQKLKMSLTSETELTIPNTKHPFFITVDASLIGLGAVLFQLNEQNKMKVISYNSRILNPQEQKLSTLDRELLGIVHALQIYEFLIIGSPHPVHIFTDHKPLLHCFTEKGNLQPHLPSLTHCQQIIPFYDTSFFNYKNYFQGFFLPDDYSLDIKTLQQQHSQDPVLRTVYSWLLNNEKPEFVTPLITGTPFLHVYYKRFSQLFIDESTNLISLYITNPTVINHSSTPNFVQDTIRICLPFRLFKTVFNKLHEHSHTGMKITYNTFKHYYYIPFLEKWLSIFIHDCIECQRNKHFYMKIQTAPTQSFSEHAPSFNYRISMDTKGPINPPSHNKSYIHVIIDAFSHFVVTVPIKSNNAKTAIKTLLHHWIIKFGPPIYLVTDRGSEYVNKEMAHLCTLMGIRHSPRTAYSPWTNGLVEVQNRNLGTHLRMFLHDTPKDWAFQVHMYAYAHNSQPLSELNISPHEIVFHTRPRIPLTFDLNLNRDTSKTCISRYCSQLPAHSHYDKSDLNPFFYKTLSKPIPHWFLAVETAMLQIYSTVYENTLRKINSLAYFTKTYHEGKPLPIGTFVLKRNFTHVHFSDKLKPLRIGPY